MKKAAIWMAAWAALGASAAVVHVSPEGNDAGDGTAGKPVATLERARELALGLRAKFPGEETVIELADGTYRIKKCVRFGKEFSGTAGAPAKIRAKNRGKARLTGGLPLPPAKALTDEEVLKKLPAEARGKVMASDLKAAGITEYGRVHARGLGDIEGMQLVWNDELQTLARWPNEGFVGIKAAVFGEGKEKGGKQRKAEGFTYDVDRPARWVGEAEPHANGFFNHFWAADRVEIGKIDAAAKTILHKGRGSAYGYGRNGLWYGYNLLSELDAPGEYYLDRAAGRLYFWPKGEADAAHPAEVTSTDSLMALDGASNVTLEGLSFENCRARALAMTGGENVKVIACAFKNIGFRALDIVKTKNARVAGCDIMRCMAGAISVFGGDKSKLEHCGVTIENNHIHHYALGQLTYAPAVRFGECGVQILRNTIHDGPHTALLFGGREHRMAYNEIHSVCIDSGEMGAIYCGRDWTLCGNEIDCNYIHDIYNPRAQRNRAIMLDDGCAGISMRSNVIVRVAEAISLSAVGNVIEANLFVSNFPAVSCWQKWEHHEDYTNKWYTHKQLLDLLAKVPVHEEPWKSKYPYLGMIDEAIKTGKLRHPDTRTVIRNNSAWGGAAEWVKFMGKKYQYSPETWVVECNTVGEAKELPPLEQYGVYKSEERLTWPVRHEVTVKCGNLEYRPNK